LNGHFARQKSGVAHPGLKFFLSPLAGESTLHNGLQIEIDARQSMQRIYWTDDRNLWKPTV